MRFDKIKILSLSLFACILLSACQSPAPASSSQEDLQSSSSAQESTVEPTPTPEASSNVSSEENDENSTDDKKTANTSNSCFENSAFVGNSMLEDLDMFGIIDNADFYAKTGLTVTTVFTESTVDGSSPIMDEVVAGNYDKVFLMFGLNELGWSYSDVFVEDYEKIIDTLRDANPDVEIYVQSLFPVSKERSDKNLYGVTNERIEEYNQMLKDMAEEKDVTYVDVHAAMVTEDGALADGASPDGVHPNMEYCETWVQYLRDHC